METLKAIEMRKATRSFKKNQISEKDLEVILKAACSAPVGRGQYDTVRLTVVQSQDLIDKVSKAAGKVTGNPDFRPFYEAPTVIVVSSQISGLNLEYANVACIMENMLLAATDLSLGSVYIWGGIQGFQAEPDLIRELGVPEGFIPISAAAIGYATDPTEAPKKHEIVINRI